VIPVQHITGTETRDYSWFYNNANAIQLIIDTVPRVYSYIYNNVTAIQPIIDKDTRVYSCFSNCNCNSSQYTYRN
jgi:hypothetical protein